MHAYFSDRVKESLSMMDPALHADVFHTGITRCYVVVMDGFFMDFHLWIKTDQQLHTITSSPTM